MNCVRRSPFSPVVCAAWIARVSTGCSIGSVHLNDAIDETKRMAALVDNLLLLSELDTDHFHWNLKRAPLRSIS